MTRDTRTFLITFLVGSTLAGMLYAKFLTVKPPEPEPTAPTSPIRVQAVPDEQPTAPTIWSQVNKDDIDRDYWERDRKKREAQIAADLHARQEAASKVQAEQSAREAQDAAATADLIWRQKLQMARDAHPDAQKVPKKYPNP